MEPILKVQNLSISFGSGNEQNKVVNAISFELDSQQILGIVGESGSGKSVTSLAILGLLQKTPPSTAVFYSTTSIYKILQKRSFKK